MPEPTDIPTYQQNSVFLQFLVRGEEWQTEIILKHVTLAVADFFESPKGDADASPSRSALPKIECKRWIHDIDSTRADAFRICDHARQAGWDHVIFVTADSIDCDRSWLEAGSYRVVLAIWDDKSQVKAFRILMRHPGFLGKQPVLLLQKLRTGTRVEDLSEWNEDANCEILNDPGETILGVPQQRPRIVAAKPAESGMGTMQLDMFLPTVFVLGSESLTDRFRVELEHFSRVEADIRRYLSDQTSMTRTELFDVMKSSRASNGKPYNWIVFFAGAESDLDQTVDAVLYSKDLATHAEKVISKKISWSEIPPAVTAQGGFSHSLEMFEKLKGITDPEIIRDPCRQICERNKIQVCSEYRRGDSLCYIVYATIRFTNQELDDIRSQLSVLMEGVEDDSDHEVDVDENSRMNNGSLNSNPGGSCRQNYYDRRKPHVFVPWDPKHGATLDQLVQIYRKVATGHSSLLPSFADEETLNDNRLMLLDAAPDDENLGNVSSDVIPASEKMAMGRFPSKYASSMSNNLSIGNMGFNDFVEEDDTTYFEIAKRSVEAHVEEIASHAKIGAKL